MCQGSILSSLNGHPADSSSQNRLVCPDPPPQLCSSLTQVFPEVWQEGVWLPGLKRGCNSTRKLARFPPIDQRRLPYLFLWVTDKTGIHHCISGLAFHSVLLSGPREKSLPGFRTRNSKAMPAPLFKNLLGIRNHVRNCVSLFALATRMLRAKSVHLIMWHGFLYLSHLI